MSKNLNGVPEKNPYKKGTSSYYVFRLIYEDRFFNSFSIRTTKEIIKRIWIKYNKKINVSNAVRNFHKLVKDGHLDRDFIEPRKGLPKGVFIWFLPQTSKEKIENFKRMFCK